MIQFGYIIESNFATLLKELIAENISPPEFCGKVLRYHILLAYFISFEKMIIYVLNRDFEDKKRLK